MLRSNLRLSREILLLGVLALLCAGPVVGPAAGADESTLSSERPELDRTQPEKTEVALFALG